MSLGLINKELLSKPTQVTTAMDGISQKEDNSSPQSHDSCPTDPTTDLDLNTELIEKQIIPKEPIRCIKIVERDPSNSYLSDRQRFFIQTSRNEDWIDGICADSDSQDWLTLDRDYILSYIRYKWLIKKSQFKINIDSDPQARRDLANVESVILDENRIDYDIMFRHISEVT